MTQTLTRERKPTVRPRKVPGSVFQTHVITHAAETVEVPVKRGPVTIDRAAPFRRRMVAWGMVFLCIALAAWPLGALLRIVVR